MTELFLVVLEMQARGANTMPHWHAYSSGIFFVSFERVVEAKSPV